VDFAFFVAAQDDGFLTHPRRVEVTWIRNQALVTNQKPRARKDLFEFFLVDACVDENFAADEAVLDVDELVYRRATSCARDYPSRPR
jgi:hypothetical protein